MCGVADSPGVRAPNILEEFEDSIHSLSHRDHLQRFPMMWIHNRLLSRAQNLADVMRKESPCSLAEPDAHPASDVAAVLRELGIALVEVEQPTQVVATRLIAVAQRYTTEDVRVVVLPRVLVIQVGTVGYEVDVTSRATTQLDLAGRVDDIAELAAAGAITPVDAVASLRAARSMRPRFGPVLMVIGYASTTVGFGMVTGPTWRLMTAYALLGAVVGVFEQLGRPFPRLAPVLPTAAAAGVTALATLIAPARGDSGLLGLIGPALVVILPGIPLALGELVASSVVAGGEPTGLRRGSVDVDRLRSVPRPAHRAAGAGAPSD